MFDFGKKDKKKNDSLIKEETKIDENSSITKESKANEELGYSNPNILEKEVNEDSKNSGLDNPMKEENSDIKDLNLDTPIKEENSGKKKLNLSSLKKEKEENLKSELSEGIKQDNGDIEKINDFKEVKKEIENPENEVSDELKDEMKKETKEEQIKKEKSDKKKKKKIILENITSYKEAMKAIDFFEATEEWEKAYKAIEEVKIKEKEAFDEIIKGLEGDENIDSKEGLKQTKIFEERINKLNKRKEKIEKDEVEFRKKEEVKRFKIRFKQIKSKINLLIKSGKSSDAMNLLNYFLRENKDKAIVIKFYNAERKKILKSIEKERKKEEARVARNVKSEAYKLIGESFEETKKEEGNEQQSGFLKKLKEKLNFYVKVKESLKKKRLLDEVNLLIDEDDKIKKQIAKEKLQNIHKGLVKEFYNDDLEGYDLYGKILGADKISGDSLGFNEGKDKYTFFIGDATGHGIKAGFILTLLTKTFEKLVNKLTLKKLAFEVNNALKQNIESKNFITGVIFQTEKKDLDKIKIAGMGHEPLIIFRDKTKTIERLTPGGLAAGIRLMINENSVKEKEIILKNGDIIFTYSDGITECRNEKGEMYNLEKLEDIILKVAPIYKDPKKIYEQIIADLKIFQGGTSFSDDASIIILRRNTDKDILKKDDEYLEELSKEQNLNKKEIKNLEGKNKTEIEVELERIKKQRDLNSIIKFLENLYVTGEILKLKQEAIRFIKKGYIDKRINAYLKKAIDNETKYKIDLKNQRISNKYNVLKQLLKKGDYDTVIKESSEIISKEGLL
ncbi:hypothetical protein CSB08_00195 [Candidatus Gracilibacteria bacterium]|nr:MAG: hypothetical protein CSB08_00195 [Candidatus Gracilibacteria bacterium]PIE85264.1 MAG: hypothetical protein CSA08_02545 [Candidatus Gracilibacteria bacterium]